MIEIKKVDRFKRVSVQLPVNIRTVDLFMDSEIMNLSQGGIFIRADIPLPLGTVVDFEFVLPDSSEKIQATGVVVWSRKRSPRKKNRSFDADPSEEESAFRHHPPGMGVQFTKIDRPDVEKILDQIENLIEISQ